MALWPKCLEKEAQKKVDGFWCFIITLPQKHLSLVSLKNKNMFLNCCPSSEIHR